MSRTYRRKGDTANAHRYYPVKSEEWWNDRLATYLSGSWKGTFITPWGEYEAKWHYPEVVEFRSYDHYVKYHRGRYFREMNGWGNAPKSYRQPFNKRLRAKQQCVIRSAVDWEAVVMPKFVKNVNYYYY